MSEDLDKINEIFRIHEENAAKAERDAGEAAGADEEKKPAPKAKRPRKAPDPIKTVDKLLTDPSGREASNYTGDEESERDYHPVRQSHEYRSGCMGGVMYAVFIICLSVVLACVAWMAASDMLALNKESFTANVVLPMEIFSSETVDKLDEDGNKTGTERVTKADIAYVSDQLKEAGLIEYKWLFELFCRFNHADTKVNPGEYVLKSSFDYRALISHMRSNSDSSLTVDVTLPEGFSMYQIFKRLEEKGVAGFDDLMESAANDKFNYEFIQRDDEGRASDLEGFLFPDTYQFYLDMEPSSAINKFLNTFFNRMDSDMVSRTQNRGLTVRELITVASLIEKEAANDEERGTIASVIYNRLEAGMPLGIDASILYEYPEHEGAPTGEMLEADSPYNTRLYTGLTPTPICNPGMASIDAALYPETTDFYYYALDTETGTHRFFTNAADHEAFVATQDYD